MRKLKFLAVAAIAVAAVGTGVYASVERSNDAMSEMVLENVEALADGEVERVVCLNYFDPCFAGVYGPYLIITN